MRRKRWLGLAVVGGTAFIACKFVPNPVGSGDDDLIDAPPADAGPCMTAPTAECAGGSLRECVTVGSAPVDTDCNWGCVDASGTAHCGILQPSGSGATGSDTDPASFGSGVADVTITATTTIDSDDGTISTVPDSMFEEATRAGDRIRVFKFKSLTIDAPIKLVGTQAIVLLADGPIIVNARIDAKGPCNADANAITPGPGGFRGGLDGDSGTNGPENGGGTGGGGRGLGSAGAGGGGHGGLGGGGGIGVGAAPGGIGGAIAGTITIDFLQGGAGGGSTAGGGGNGKGGGGGGAIQLVSNTRIAINQGGSIDAGGCGGDSGNGGGADGGGGGGAGGAILLEAPSIEGGGQLAVNGGAGGAGDNENSTTGSSGTLGRGSASGAPGSTTGGSGGNGAAGAVFTGSVGIDHPLHAGGGGGGVGRIRLNTRTGTVAATAEMSPAITDAGSACTAGPANVQ